MRRSGLRWPATPPDAEAVAYVELAADGHKLFGVGRHRNITAASLSAVISGVNRLMKERG